MRFTTLVTLSFISWALENGWAQNTCYAGPQCNPANTFEVWIPGNGVYTPADYPVATNCEIYANGSLVNIVSITVSEPIGYFNWITPMSTTYEGQVITTSGQWWSTSTTGPASMSGTCSSTRYYDRLEPEMFICSAQVMDCAAGLFRLVFTDDPAEPGNVTINDRWAGIYYHLVRNGTMLTQGSLSQAHVPSPPSFVFDGLTSGSYVLTLEENLQDGYRYCGTASWTFTVPQAGDCSTNLHLTAALQGPSVPGSTLMTDALRTGGMLPLIEPYSAAGYVYTGTSPGAATTPALLATTGNDAVVDWVVVELRSASTPSLVLHSQPALLQRDRDIVSLNGRPYISFPQNAGSYHVAVRHRNHLGIMSGVAQALGPVSLNLELAATGTPVFGTSPRASVTGGGALWAGDATGNGVIKYTGSGNDRDPILIAVGSTTPNATVPNVYDRRDTNLDGVIKYTGTANDRDIILTNVGSTTPNNTRTQQLP